MLLNMQSKICVITPISLSLYMLKNSLYIICLFTTTTIYSQSRTDIELEAQPVGGKEQVDQVLQTQLNLPKTILTSNFDKELTAFFDLDSAGNAIHLKLEGGLNNVLRIELTRMFRFLKFKRSQSSQYQPDPYFLIFKLSTEKYNKYYKQRAKLIFKKPLPADSTYIIHKKADKSPEYFKNGEEGLAEYILSEIEYPKLAIEKSIEGTVVVEFVVETNGYVTGITLKQTISAGCSDEAIKLIKQTRWQPAQLNGKYVRYKNTYPITFSLRNVNKDNSGSSTIGQ